MNRILFIYLIVVIYCTGLLNAQDPCQNVQSITVSCYQNQGFCSTTMQCQLRDTYYFDSMSISPSLPMSEYNGAYYVEITQSGNYTATATLGACTRTSTFEVLLANYIVTPPQCYGENYTIAGSSPFFNGSYLFSHDYNTWVPALTGVTRPYSYDAVPLYVLQISSNNYTCYTNFNIHPVHNVVPQLQFVKPTCSEATGKIIVTNYQQFSSLTLKMDNLLNNLTAVNGVFSGLQVSSGSQQLYTLYAKSDLCSTTMVETGTFYNYNPTINVKAEPISQSTCNNTHTYLTFTVSGLPSLSTNNVTVDNVNYTIGKKYIFPVNEYYIGYTGNGCEYFTNYDTYFNIAPVTYSAINVPPTCATNSTITITSVSQDYASLTINSNKFGILQLNASHQVTRVKDDMITINDNCGRIYVGYDDYTPKVTRTQDSTDCAGNMTVIVQNYQLYDLLQLSNSFNTVQAKAGKFVNVWYGLYTLTYRVAGCTQNYTLNIGNNPSTSMDTSFLRYNVEYIVPKTQCSDNFTTISVTPIFKNLVSTTSTTLTLNSSSSGTVSVPFTHPRCPYPGTPNFNVDPYKNFPAPTFSIVSKPKCKSSWVLIKMETTIPYTKVYVPNIGYIPRRDDGIYPVDPNNNLYITVYYPCGSQYYYFNSLLSGITPTDPSSDVSYTVTPQSNSDCQVASGSIKINNPSQYTQLTLNSMNATNGAWDQLGSSDYFLVYNHSYCGFGAKYVNVPTSTSGLNFKTTILNQATCYSYYQGDASLFINITRNNGAKFEYDEITEDQAYYNYDTRVLHGLGGGERQLYISSGNCYIKHTVNVPTKITSQAYKLTVLNYPESEIQTGLIRIDPLIDGLTINWVESYLGRVSQDNKYLYGYNYQYYQEELETVQIRFNAYCNEYLSLNMSNPKSYYPQYTATSSKQCGNNQATVSFSQDTLDIYNINLYGYGPVTSTAPIAVNNYDSLTYSYQEKTTMIIEFDYIYFEELQGFTPTISITNETCVGSKDGAVTVSGVDFINTMVSLKDNNGYTLPSKFVGSSIVFYNLSSQNYPLSIQSKTNPLCDYYQYVYVPSDNPSFNYEYSYICYDYDNYVTVKNGTFIPKVEPSDYQVSLAVDGVNIQGSMFSVGQEGRYFITVNATKGQCTRTFYRFQQLWIYGVYNIKAVSLKCGEIIADGDGNSLALYTADGKLVQSGNVYQDTYRFSGLPAGNYKVDVAGRECMRPAYVTVESCDASDSSMLTPTSFTTFIALLFITLVTFIFN